MNEIIVLGHTQPPDFVKYWVVLALVFFWYQFSNKTKSDLLNDMGVVGIMIIVETIINNWWRIW